MKLKFKIFIQQTGDNLQKHVNDWLSRHPNITIEKSEFSVTPESIQEVRVLYLTVWYYEP